MRSLRTALLIAAATLAIGPAFAQDQDARGGRRGRDVEDLRVTGGPARSFQQAPMARPAPVAQPALVAQPAPVAQSAPVARNDYGRGQGQRSNWNGGGDRGNRPSGDQRGQFSGDRGQPGRVDAGQGQRPGGADRGQWTRGDAGRWNGQQQVGGNDRRNDDRRGGQWTGGDRNGNGRNDNDGRQWTGGNRNGNDGNLNRDRHNDRDGRWTNDRRDDRRWTGNRNRPSTSWRNDRRYDWQSWRNNNRDLFRRGHYNAPRGYGFGYRSVYRGFLLEPFFYASNYWLADPYQYRLPPAEWPYRWIRYYNDALLVDTTNGEVVDAIQNFFY